MARRTVRSWRSRWARRLLGGVVVLLLAVVCFTAFLLGTTSGGRVAVSWVPGVLSKDLELEVGEFSGRLVDRFELRGLELRLPTLELTAERVAIDWRAAGLLRKRMHAYAVAVDGLSVTLTEGTEGSPGRGESLPPDSLPLSPIPALPVAISFDSVAVTDATLRTGDSVWLSGGNAVVRGTPEDYRLSFSGRAEFPDLPPADFSLAGTGSSTAMRLETLDARTLDGTLAIAGNLSWWPVVTWDADFRADTLRPATLMPDPAEWPGTMSLTGSSSGKILSTGGAEIDAVVDTLFGELRGEPLGGRFEARLRGEDLELATAQVAWGPARGGVSGTAGRTLDLEFEVTAPDLDLLFPGSGGRVTARGRATGLRDTPRVQASFEAAGLTLEKIRVATAEGEVDLDLAGPLGAAVIARDMSLGGREIDSATVFLSGRRDLHTLEAIVRGPGAEVDIVASGGLDGEYAWTGTVETLRFAADTVGSWTLAEPVEVFASADAVRLSRACLESPPARVCAAAETGGGRLGVAATVDSLSVARLAPLMPEGVSSEAVLTAELDFEMGADAGLNGRLELRTSAGSLTRPVRGESRTLFFEPVEIVASSGPGGLQGAIDLHVTDSTGARVLDAAGRLESAVAIQSAKDLSTFGVHPLSAHLEVEADDLLLLTHDLFPQWDVSGSFRAAADLEVDPLGGLTGRLVAATDSLALRNTVRGERWTLIVDTARAEAELGPAGLTGAIDLQVTDSTGVRILDVGGRLESAVVIRSVEDLSAIRGHPLTAHLEVEADDLLLLTHDLFPKWDVSGSFRAAADLEVDPDGGLTGSVVAATDSMALRNTVRGQGWILLVDPARAEAEIGPDGLTGQLELAVQGSNRNDLLEVTGRVRLPRLTTLDVNPEDQPVDGSLEVGIDDLSLVEAFLIEVSHARGSFLLTSTVGGTLADLTVDGRADVTDGYALIPTLGLELKEGRLSASGQPNGRIEVTGQVRSGDGLLTLTGRTERYPSAESPSVFQVRGERFLLMDIPEVNLLASPSLDLTFDGSTLRLTGDVLIPRGRLGFPEIPPTAVTPSEDVVIVGDSLAKKAPPVPFSTDLMVTLGDDVFFSGFGFTSHLVGAVRVQQSARGDPTGRGEVRFVGGTYRSFGQELRVDPGRLLFSGPIDDPTVDARAFVRASDGTEAGLRIGGTVQKLDVSTYSVPPKSDSDVMSYILFGRPMSQTTGTEGSQASNTAAVLGANMLAMSLAPSIGLDEARIDTGSSQNKAQFVVGKYLSPKLYLGYGVGIYEPISTLRIRYLLSARWSIEAITGDQQSTDLLWRIETGGSKPEATGEEGAGATPAPEAE